MINKTFSAMLNEKDIIFEIFDYANKRRAEVGADKVYDFSLGNPSVPAPDCVGETMIHQIQTLPPLALHGYSPSFGIMAVREQIATGLNHQYRPDVCAVETPTSLVDSPVDPTAKFMTQRTPSSCPPYTARNIFMTIGAAGALAHALRACTNPGDEIITFAPCFSEYKPYTAGAGLNLKIVPADIDTFQINFDALDQLFTPAVTAVLINSPNNPSGIVYSTETIKQLAAMLTQKSNAYDHPIYLISDEPYRDIIFAGTDSPYIANYYKDTLTCYSFSKSLSLPGERIGYLAVNPDCTDADLIIDICPQISRTIGQNGAASLMQRTVGENCRVTADLTIYERNKEILYEALTDYGYTCVEPGGTFYMFPRSPEPDSLAFCKRAMAKDLMLVPGDIFGCPGHFRIAYCVPTERVLAALPVFKALIETSMS